MATQIFKIKRNDTLPVLQIAVKGRGNLGEKIDYDLSNVTSVTFSMKDDCNNLKVYDQTAEIICASGGTIQYIWQSGDTDTAGKYLGEFELTFSGVSGNSILSVPQQGGIPIEINSDINNFD